jgi:PAS domain-containing protein
MLLKLIGTFEDQCTKLLSAVRHGDESAVGRIDSEIQPLIQRIFQFYARDNKEAIQQLRFFARLAVRNSEDDDSVARYTDMMTALFDRYLRAGLAFSPPEREDLDQEPGAPSQALADRTLADGYDPSPQELVLDSLPDRIAVVGLDYRYIYTNKRNGDFHGKSPSSFVGRHISDFIDKQRFYDRAKPRLDQCFGGARLSYNYEIADLRGRMFDVNCGMTPFLGPDKVIAGALITLKMHPLFARVA